jgi:hypothetical protein
LKLKDIISRILDNPKLYQRENLVTETVKPENEINFGLAQAKLIYSGDGTIAFCLLTKEDLVKLYDLCKK